jgi:hypothetical protein
MMRRNTPKRAAADRAVIGRLQCNCVVAADLDCDSKSAIRYMKLGYKIETVGVDEAKRLLRESNCRHGKS